MVEQAARAPSVPMPAAPVMLMAAMVVLAMFMTKIAVVEGSPPLLSAVTVMVPVRIVVGTAIVV
jgi:hypothetical protein